MYYCSLGRSLLIGAWILRTAASFSSTPACTRLYRQATSVTSDPFESSKILRGSFGTSSSRLYVSTPEELRLDPKKEPLVKAYGWAKNLYAFLAVTLLVMPDRTFAARLASKWGGVAGYALAAGACNMLKGAARAGRLASDTYKRLNVGLLVFCSTFWAMPAEAGFLSQTSSVQMMTFVLCAAKSFGLVLALQGWQYGIDKEGEVFFKPGRMVSEIFSGSWDTLKGLRVKNAKKALAYRNLLLMVLAGLMSSLFEGLFDVRYADAFKRSIFDISIQWSAISRLFLISTMIYSLKDAAERDRLAGSTFIQMNILVGSWALAVGFAQGARGYWIEMLAFALPFFIKAYKAIKEKKENA